MSHSTTGTSSYILTKYSRSYPVKRTLQKAQIGLKSGPETAQEWQHFTNPTIRLVLDVKTSGIGEAQSVRLRILWQMDVELNQPDVSFASFFFVLLYHHLGLGLNWVLGRLRSVVVWFYRF